MRELHSDARATQDRKSEPAKEAPHERRDWPRARTENAHGTGQAIPEIFFCLFCISFTAKLSLALGSDETCARASVRRSVQISV